jgi:hypothetical protein
VGPVAVGAGLLSAAAGAYAVIAAIVIGGSGAAISAGIVLGAIIGIAGITNAVTKK